MCRSVLPLTMKRHSNMYKVEDAKGIHLKSKKHVYQAHINGINSYFLVALQDNKKHKFKIRKQCQEEIKIETRTPFL